MKEYYRAQVTAIERTGRKDPVITFNVSTNLPRFRTTQFRDVRRTHSEFEALAKHLVRAYPECIVPVVPSAKTSAGFGSEEDISEIKAGCQLWLDRVSADPTLIRDEEIILFTESDFGYSPTLIKRAPASGIRRKAIKMQAPPPDDTPQLLELRPIVKQFYLDTADVASKLERCSRARRQLATAQTDLGQRFGALGQLDSETHAGMARALRRLGKTIQTMSDLIQAQATAESSTLGDKLNYFSQSAFVLKETLTNRQILLRDLLSAQQATIQRHQALMRLKSQSNIAPAKTEEAIAALEDAKTNEEQLQTKCSRVTTNLLKQSHTWRHLLAYDVRQTLHSHAERQIEIERKILSTLESIRPDIRAIDATGGLSWLGREEGRSRPRGTSRAGQSSQTAHGDAWSGVERQQRKPTARSNEETVDAKSAAQQLSTL